MLSDEVREEFPYFVHGDDRCVDTNLLLVGDVAAQFVLMLTPGNLQKARLLESTFATDTFLPVAEIQLITLEGQL